MSRSAPVSPLSIASRVLAAAVGGYAVAYATTAFLTYYTTCLSRGDCFTGNRRTVVATASYSF